ncbi:MAG: hypothetical protein SPL30_09990 [Succinivibrio sp.]|jgi:hypothetical protein|nr:hypothetical protein [Succinivibrio sp.]
MTVSSETLNRRRNSFEPRMGTAQLVFGIIYAFIAGIGIVLAIYTWINSGHQHPWTQYFFVALFLFLAGKSFYLYAKVRILFQNGTHTTARVETIAKDRGLTVVTGFVQLNGNEEFEIESRYAGESVAAELDRFLKDEHTKLLPALVVGLDGKHPRGMFLIKTHAGHIDPQYKIQLKTDRKK